MFWDYQPHLMGIRSQNMTQTSNSLLSPTKSMVAMGNHLCAPLCTPSVHPLHTPPGTPPCTPPCTPPRTLHAPLCTSLHAPLWLVKCPTTSNHIPAFKNLINIKSWFFPHHLFEKPPSSQHRSINWRKRASNYTFKGFWENHQVQWSPLLSDSGYKITVTHKMYSEKDIKIFLHVFLIFDNQTTEMTAWC